MWAHVHMDVIAMRRVTHHVMMMVTQPHNVCQIHVIVILPVLLQIVYALVGIHAVVVVWSPLRPLRQLQPQQQYLAQPLQQRQQRQQPLLQQPSQQ